jgi:hypothetical protein
MRNKSSIRALLLVSLWSLATGLAQAAGTPEAAVKEYMAALQKDGMVAVSRFLHPDELKRFKEMLLPMFRKDAAAKSEVIHGIYGAEATLTSVEAMPPAEFMDGFMRLAGEQLAGATFGDADVLGTVSEKDVVHVLARATTRIKELQVKTVTVVSTRKSGADWKLMLTGELEGLATALAAQ